MRSILKLVLTIPLLLLAMAHPLAAQDAGNQDRDLGSAIRAYLLENPEVIIEALQVLEERRALQAAANDKALVAANAGSLFDDGYSFVVGNPDGEITIVEFLDYRCPYCKRAHEQIARLLEGQPEVRLVIKEFPVLGHQSVTAARVAIAAAAVDPSKFKLLHEALMTFPAELEENSVYQLAAGLGYDVEALRLEAEGDATSAKLEANYRLAETMGLTGTPSFVVEDEIVRGILPEDQMWALVESKKTSN
ncbi:MAG: DsbA family protein [Pseudomonadota bacterium]